MAAVHDRRPGLAGPLPLAWGGEPPGRAAALVDVGLALSSTLDPDALLARVVERTTQLVGADGATLFLLDRERRELWSKVLRGARLREIRLPLGRGVAGWAAKHAQAVRVADAYADPRFDADVDRRSGYRTRAIVCVPLVGRSGRVEGVLEVVHRRPGAFGPEEERLVAAVASQAAVAVENARLFAEAAERNAELAAAREALEHRVAELDLLLGVEQRLAAHAELPIGIDAVLERTMQVIGADAGSVLLLEERSGQLYFRTARGGRPDEVMAIRIPRGKGIAGAVAERGRPILANDVRRERAFDGAVAERVGYAVVSALCVPVTHGRQVLGALELLNKRGGFTPGDQALAQAVASPIGARVAHEREREERGREERLATIGQLLSGVMHDLRNPMTAISGFTQLMVNEEDRARREETCELLLKQFALVNAMTQEVLDFARGKVQVLRRKVLVNEFVAELTGALRHELEPAGVELRVKLGYSSAARFDEVKLRRAVVNVARNAAQAMPRGGRFTLEVLRRRDRLVFRMSDTGPGIAEEIRERVFQSFATHGREEGTGLGLAIVKRIAEEHGGTITFRTRRGQGTTFVLSVPM